MRLAYVTLIGEQRRDGVGGWKSDDEKGLIGII